MNLFTHSGIPGIPDSWYIGISNRVRLSRENMSSSSQTVVIEVACGYILAGFSFESEPRLRMDSIVCEMCESKVEQDVVYLQVLKELSALFGKHLIVKPKDWRVLVVEPLLCPNILRDSVVTALLSVFHVQSVAIQPNLYMPILCTPMETGLILHIGEKESIAVAIFDNRPVIQSLKVSNTCLKKAYSEFIKRHDWKPCVQSRSIFDQLVFGTYRSHSSSSSSSRSKLSSESDVTTVVLPFGTNSKDSKDGEASAIVMTPKILSQEDINAPIEMLVCGLLANGMPDYDDEIGGLAGLLLSCAMQCPLDIRGSILNHVICCGEGSDIPGLAMSLSRQATMLAKSDDFSQYHSINATISSCVGGEVRVAPNPFESKKELTWIGGSLFASLKSNDSKFLSLSHFYPDGHKHSQGVLLTPDWLACT